MDVEQSEKALEELSAAIQPATPTDDRERELSKVCVMHPSLIAPTHARAVVVRKILLLYNPTSGAQQGVKIAEDAMGKFLAAKIEVHAIALERRGHGEEICQKMNITQFDVLCFIGGDGTFHECVNGLMKREDGLGGQVPIAMIAGGTGNSFSLELQGDTDLSLAVENIIRGIHVPIDIGKVIQLDTSHGKLEKDVIYSFNSMHWGLAGKVAVMAEKLRWMGKAVRYTTAALLEMVKGHSTWAAISFEDSEGNVVEYKEKFCLAIANNIMTAAKGMKMAPKAKLNDGLMDLLLIRSHNAIDLFNVFSKVYAGTHTDLEYVEYKQVKWFSIVTYNPESGEAATDENTAEEVVDIDGELKGATPFRCEVLRYAIKVIV